MVQVMRLLQQSGAITGKLTAMNDRDQMLRCTVNQMLLLLLLLLLMAFSRSTTVSFICVR